MTLDTETLLFVVENMEERARAARIMREDAMRLGETGVAAVHGDRAGAFLEVAVAMLALCDVEPKP